MYPNQGHGPKQVVFGERVVMVLKGSSFQTFRVDALQHGNVHPSCRLVNDILALSLCWDANWITPGQRWPLWGRVWTTFKSMRSSGSLQNGRKYKRFAGV